MMTIIKGDTNVPVETPEEWITRRYGKPSIDSKPVFIATVKVMGGISVGTGFTEVDAYKNLYKDLTQTDWNNDDNR